MNDKEFVLVSQGIEIMRTKSQENAINYVKKKMMNGLIINKDVLITMKIMLTITLIWR